MSADIQDVFSQVTGEPATPKQIQRVKSLAHTLGIRHDAPLLLYFAALDAHASIIDGLAERAKAIGNAAASEATEEIARQLGEILPTIQAGIEAGATKAASRIQFGKSVVSIWGALAGISLTFALGWAAGGVAVGHAALSRWGLASRIAVPVILFAGLIMLTEESPTVQKTGWILLALALVSSTALAGLVWISLESILGASGRV